MKDLLDLQSVALRYSEDADNVLIEPIAKDEFLQIANWLTELQERREKDCDHEIFPIKNKEIDSGFMCAKCYKFFREFFGEFNLEKEKEG